MGPPRSKSKTVFVKCPTCLCSFGTSDQGNHGALCRSFPLSESGRLPLPLPHGFIMDGCLTAVPRKEDPPEKLPKTLYNDVVILPVPAMQLLGFCIGDPVIIQSIDVHSDNSTPRVLKAWPSPSTDSKTSIGLVKCSTAGLQPVDIPAAMTGTPLTKPYQTAHEVHIKPRENKVHLHTPEFAEYIQRWCDGRYLTTGNTLHITYFAHPCSVDVTDVKGNESTMDNITTDLAQMSIEGGNPNSSQTRTFYRISSLTKFILDSELTDKNCENESSCLLSLEQIGGMGGQLDKLQELMDLHFRKKSLAHKGLSLPKGILLHGPSGTGKTMLAKALMVYAGVHVVEIQGTELWDRYYGVSEARLAAKFQQAQDFAPSIIFIDEVDAVCPKRQNSHNEVEKRVVSSLMTLLDKTLSSEKPVVVIAATNKLSDIDTGLRRPGRLEKEIEIGVPSAKDREEILKSLLLNTKHDLSDEHLKDTAAQAHGFVGADLSAVCKEAGILALKSGRPGDVHVQLCDVTAAFQTVQPSAMREVALEISQVSWEDIGGQAELKHKLRQAIEWPLKHPDSFLRLGIRPPRGLLMYGPPGCSKTMIAKALAHESGLNFIAIKGPELFSKWVGESERAVREVFRKARAAAPAIVFFDEIDSIAGERGSGSSGGGEVGDRVLAQMLTEIDGVVALQDVTIVAATNRPERIDKALLRPGRLDRIVYVPLPDEDTRRQIFNIHFRKTPVAEDVDVDWLVERTNRYSGAEVSAVCHEAALSAMHEDLSIEQVHKRHFETALNTVTPRISPAVIKGYDDYARNSGLHSL